MKGGASPLEFAAPLVIALRANEITGACEVSKGTVKFFNSMKGYGFLRSDAGRDGKTGSYFSTKKGYGFIYPHEEGDAFVHTSSVPKGYVASGAVIIPGEPLGSFAKGYVIGPGTKLGKTGVTGSFALPNGDRIGTVRRDVMARVLGRAPGDGR